MLIAAHYSLLASCCLLLATFDALLMANYHPYCACLLPSTYY